MQTTKTIDELVIEERKAYFKEWRANNKDKVKKHNSTYWQKRVEKKLQRDTINAE